MKCLKRLLPGGFTPTKPMSDDLVNRLEIAAYGTRLLILMEARDELEALRAENAAIKVADAERERIVRLVASFPIGDCTPDDVPLYGLDGVYLTHGDIRAARAAINERKET